ncbi:Neurotransmitter-gated ion-channel ligand-binding domain, partial [Trinorchestia longiramus]
DFTLDLFLRQRWRDPRLAYTQGLPSYTIIDPQLQEKIWKPDTFFENVKVASLHSVTMPNILLNLRQSGDVLYSMRLTLRLSCMLELELYPFDAQTCYVDLSSCEYRAVRLVLLADMHHQLGRLVSESACERKDPGSNPAADMVDAARNTAWDLDANVDDVIKYSWSEVDALEIDDSIEISEFDLMNYGTSNRTTAISTGELCACTLCVVVSVCMHSVCGSVRVHALCVW